MICSKLRIESKSISMVKLAIEVKNECEM